jgi:hypothetical protein
MSYSTPAYATSRIEELHRAGAEERRAAARAGHPRIGLVIALLRRHDAERAERSGRKALVGRASVAR